jgi:hypothetical protein
MHTRRFGRKLKLPSTVAIKHGILKLMIQDELKAQAFAPKAEEVARGQRRFGVLPEPKIASGL